MIRTTTLLTAILAAASLSAQDADAKIVTFGGNSDMKTSSVYLFDRAAQKLAANYTFCYGQPVWKEAHEKVVESGQDGSIRLGQNEWASLDTSTALNIGNTRVPAGQWYLGLRRESGSYFLMVMKADTVRKLKLGAWQTQSMKAKINCALEYAKVEALQKKLTIVAKADKKNPKRGSFTLRWGNHQLTAPIQVLTKEKTEKGHGEHDDEHEHEHEPGKTKR